MKFNIFNWLDEQGYAGSDGDGFINWILWHGACLKYQIKKDKGFEFPFEQGLDNERFVSIHEKFCAVIVATGSYFMAVYAMMDENDARFALEFTNEYNKHLDEMVDFDQPPRRVGTAHR